MKDKQYLKHLTYYIHHNAQKHGLTENFRNWHWSSYREIISANNSDIHKEIISWFGSIDDYLNYHTLMSTDFL